MKCEALYEGSKISGSQESFLTDRDGHYCVDNVMEEMNGLRLCSRVQSCTGKSYMSIF